MNVYSSLLVARIWWQKARTWIATKVSLSFWVYPCLLCGRIYCQRQDHLSASEPWVNPIEDHLAGYPVWSALSHHDPRWLHLNIVKNEQVIESLYPLIQRLNITLGPSVLRAMSTHEMRAPWVVCAIPPRNRGLRRRGISPQHHFAQSLTTELNRLIHSEASRLDDPPLESQDSPRGLQCHYQPRMISRIRHTSRQRHLTRAERMIAQRDSLNVNSLAYSSVVLVDDVMTTGGTLREGIRALEDAGAQQIIAVTLFRVDTHNMMSHEDELITPSTRQKTCNLS